MANSSAGLINSKLPTWLRSINYQVALAAVTGLDYFDNTLFTYFASNIAGGVNAPADELVWASSAYAIGAVLGILRQQWWIERFGNKRFIAGCMFLYAIAALASSLTESSIQLAVTRAIQGYLVGPMMGTCRILLQSELVPKPVQIRGRRFFLMGIVVSSALAPIVGGMLLSRFEWRSLFVFQAPLGILLGIFALFAIPRDVDRGRIWRLDTSSPAQLHAGFVFAISQALLQFALQQMHFQLFTLSGPQPIVLLFGLACLGYFFYHQWHHPQPLVRLHGVRDTTFLTGIALYSVYYYLTTAFGYLTIRLLEGGLGYPIDHTGFFVGSTSLISAFFLILHFRYSGRITQKKWLIVPGFVIAAIASQLLARIPPDVGQSSLILPLLLRGMLVMFIASPVANLTFKSLDQEEFSHSYRLKNIIRQLVISFATTSIIILERHREAFHYARLIEQATPFNPQYGDLLARLRNAELIAPDATTPALLAQIAKLVEHQASFQSILDGFQFLVVVAICGGLFAILQRRIK